MKQPDEGRIRHALYIHLKILSNRAHTQASALKYEGWSLNRNFLRCVPEIDQYCILLSSLS